MAETKNSFSYFCNRECEYFPCHGDKDREVEYFNCLFCYCPLYMLGSECGGNVHYMENGIKDCSKCMLPHSKGGYEYINKKFMQIVETMSKQKLAEDRKKE
ncbi:cysteine-rich small domain-containing protein [Filifactor villosus]|uniref:Cysteine-rich small domain-containing protein n=1 Tax=Filifactor villosus TaxID=29374 RepID=A0ABV9QNM0_9FIRM